MGMLIFKLKLVNEVDIRSLNFEDEKLQTANVSDKEQFLNYLTQEINFQSLLIFRFFVNFRFELNVCFWGQFSVSSLSGLLCCELQLFQKSMLSIFQSLSTFLCQMKELLENDGERYVMKWILSAFVVKNFLRDILSPDRK